MIHQRGIRLAVTVQQRQTALVRRALPDLAEQILSEPGWPALAATLADAQRAGHDPAVLLAEATRRRELDTATSISEVLVWRIRHHAHPPTTSANPQAIPPASSPYTSVTPPGAPTSNHSSRRR